eukprot:2940201-Pleurochrysis_carterae.AAC.1
MIYGGKRYPGGAPAWVPSLVLLLGECRLETRSKQAAAGAGSGKQSAGSSHTSPSMCSLQQLLQNKFGKSLAIDLLRALRIYDAYLAWRTTCDMDTPDDAAKER